MPKVPEDELDAWNRAAAGWERRNDLVTRMTGPVARRMVELLDPQPGETVLELAAGVGDTGYLAAEALGADGRLISTDFSPGMVDVARRRAATLGVANAEHRVLDAVALDLPDGSVDGVLCRFALMLIPEPGACSPRPGACFATRADAPSSPSGPRRSGTHGRRRSAGR